MKKALLVVSLFMVVALFAAPSFAFEVISATEAHDDAIAFPDTFIIDVRAPEEWKWVAHPGSDKLGVGAGLDGKVINIPSMLMKKGAMVINKRFVKDVEDYFGEGFDGVLITMCRSGFRGGRAAALLEAAGYTAKNMEHGFEGDADAAGYRRTVNGWIVDELPYTYATVEGTGYVK